MARFTPRPALLPEKVFPYCNKVLVKELSMTKKEKREREREREHINPLALELDIYSLAHHLCKM